MNKCKPVFKSHRLIYYRRPRLRLPQSTDWLPALVGLAKSQRREVEAICRQLTRHTAGAQMLHYLLRWFKSKSSVRMSEADWIQKLGLSKKEVRYGKQALALAGLAVTVETHATGRATVYSIEPRRFLQRLNTVLNMPLTSLLKQMGVCPMGTDGSVQWGRMGLSNGGRTVITESTQNLSHQESDDDEKSVSDSGEFSFSQEGRDEQRDKADASRKFLEEQGVKAPALAAAAKHPLPELERAFELANEHAARNKAAYALAVLTNGDYKPKPNWMQPDYKPSSSFGNSSAVKSDVRHFAPSRTDFHKSSWSDFAEEVDAHA